MEDLLPNTGNSPGRSTKPKAVYQHAGPGLSPEALVQFVQEGVGRWIGKNGIPIDGFLDPSKRGFSAMLAQLSHGPGYSG